MNHRLPLITLLLLMSCAPAVSRAQDTTPGLGSPGSEATPAGSDAVPTGSTVINSDELHADQKSNTSVFTGNVVVTGTNFTMTCLEMTVTFTKDNKITEIVATGNVVITQPNRITTSDEARYFKDEDKFVLTGRPSIIDNKNKVSAPIITIYRTTQQMITSGGHTTVILAPGNGTPTTTQTPPTTVNP